MSTAALFTPLQLGRYRLAHRVVMAPLTRMRAGQPGNVPTTLNAEYYGQRATPGGLIIAEASQISPTAQGYPATPGIHSPAQIDGWRQVTEAVHAKGGLIFLQLWHVGRVSHSSLLPDGVLPVAPSALPPAGEIMNAGFQAVPYEVPRALETAEIAGVIADYAQAARNAQAAGFDGVEVHGANGYLIEQFLQSRSNQRGDAYGGSLENRLRLLLDVVAAVVEVWGADRVGVRLSPFGIANGSGEDEPLPLYSAAVRALDPLGLAYLHLIEPRASGAGRAEVDHQNVPVAAELIRPLWSGPLLTAGNFQGESAAALVAAGQADAIGFGRFFIANPDLPARLARGAALRPYQRSTFYGGGAEGYTDYLPLDAAAAE